MGFMKAIRTPEALLVFLICLDVMLIAPRLDNCEGTPLIGPVFFEYYKDDCKTTFSELNRLYIIPVVILIGIAYWIKHSRDSINIIRVGAVSLLILGLMFLIQLGGISFSCDYSIYSGGFYKVTPLLAGTSMTREGTFHGVFKNDQGLPIQVNPKEIEVRWMYGNKTLCASADNMVYQHGPPLPQGETFQFTVGGCKSGNTGEAYVICVNVPYIAPESGLERHHNTTGIISGYYE